MHECFWMSKLHDVSSVSSPHWPDEVSHSGVKLQEEDLPAQLQQTAHRLWAAGIRQTVDLTLDLLQLCSCTAPTGEHTYSTGYDWQRTDLYWCFITYSILLVQCHQAEIQYPPTDAFSASPVSCKRVLCVSQSGETNQVINDVMKSWNYLQSVVESCRAHLFRSEQQVIDKKVNSNT